MGQFIRKRHFCLEHEYIRLTVLCRILHAGDDTLRISDLENRRAGKSRAFRRPSGIIINIQLF